jgi:hypothetical protein
MENRWAEVICSGAHRTTLLQRNAKKTAIKISLFNQGLFTSVENFYKLCKNSFYQLSIIN